jgi:hypothetical protein
MDSSMAPAQPQASQIPDLVKIGAVSTDTAINVQTDILDPVIFSDSECRFVLENKGILHSNSRITFSSLGDCVDNASIGETRAFYPANVGINSVIQRASLRVGTKTICEIEDFGHFSAYETCFLPPDAIKEREQVMTGRFMTIEPKFLNRSTKFASGDSTANLTESIKESESIGIDNARDATLTSPEAGFFNVPANASAPTPTGVVWDWQNERRKPQYSVLLADLFPFLKLNQLPLYLMSEQVSIHLTFVTKKADGSAATSERLCHNSAQIPQKDITLTRPDCQMVSDYIFYPQDMMEQYRQANSTMSFNYVDYQFMKRSVSDTEYENGLIQNIGGAGRIVNKVMVMAVADSANADSLLNVYSADGPVVTANTNGIVTTNIKYNDNFLFPVDVSNDARHYHNVFQSEGRVPYISRDLYRGEGVLATRSADTPGAEEFEGHSMLDTLRQQFFYTAYRLNKGERVNSRGIELYDTRTAMSGASTLRVYLQVVKMATLRDGIMEIAFA